MDISSLSRQLNMSIHELRQKMREAGIRVSPRARKINNTLAREVVRKLTNQAPEPEPEAAKGPEKIAVPPFVSVKDFAVLLEQPVTEVIKKLIENGVMATINEDITIPLSFPSSKAITKLMFEPASENGLYLTMPTFWTFARLLSTNSDMISPSSLRFLP